MRPKFLLLKAGNLTVNVRFESLADIRIAKRHVRFTPKSGHVLATAPRFVCQPPGPSVMM